MANYGFTGREQNQKGCYGTKLIGQARIADLQDKARERLGLRARKVTSRLCLRCDIKFVSRNENRICAECSEINQEIY